MRFDIVTIFPGFFESIFVHGIVRRAQAEGLVEIGLHDLRAYAHDRHRTVDDRPFGGGEGMVLKPEPLAEALQALGIRAKAQRATTAKTRVILLSAQGRVLTQAVAREFAALDRVVLICGRYEGVDERINDIYCDMELSIGDYVLSGGELAAAVVVDATMRLLPGVLGNEAAGQFESSRRDRPLAARAAVAQNVEEPAVPAGTSDIEPRRLQNAGGNPRRGALSDSRMWCGLQHGKGAVKKVAFFVHKKP